MHWAIFYFGIIKILLTKGEFVFKWNSEKFLNFFDEKGHPVKIGWPVVVYFRLREP